MNHSTEKYLNGFKELSPPDISSDEDEDDMESKASTGSKMQTITLASGKKIQQEIPEDKECCPKCPMKLKNRKMKLRASLIITNVRAMVYSWTLIVFLLAMVSIFLVPCDIFTEKVCDAWEDKDINGNLVLDRLIEIQKENEQLGIIGRFTYLNNEAIKLDEKTILKRWIKDDRDWFLNQHYSAGAFIVFTLIIEWVSMFFVEDLSEYSTFMKIAYFGAVGLMHAVPMQEI